MPTLKIEDGILKELSHNEEETESKKANWFYRIETSDGNFRIIDYDKDKARPYVKALLAKVNKLREVKLLYLTIVLIILIVAETAVFGIVVSNQVSEVAKLAKEVKERVDKPIVKPSERRPVFDNMDAFETSGQRSQTGIVNPIFE